MSSAPIPEDLKQMYEQCKLQAFNITQYSGGTIAYVIERIAKVEADRDALQQLLNLNQQGVNAVMATIENTRKTQAELATARETIARLSAPVSDEEWDWNSLAHNADEWKGWFNTLIAARAKAKQ